MNRPAPCRFTVRAQVLRAVIAVLVLDSSAVCAEAVWSGQGTTSHWSDSGNWGTFYGFPANDGTATISFQSTDPATPFLDIDWSIASLTFSTGAWSYSLGGNATLSIGSGGITQDAFSAQTISHAIALTANQAWSTTGGNLTVSGVVSGTGALTKTGSYTLKLSGANTYSGGTAISAGTIEFSALNNFGTGSLTLDGGGVRWASGTTTDISSRLTALGASGGTFDTNGNNVTLATALSGTGGLTKTGSGTLTLSANNTYSGNTTISAGTLQVGTGGNSGTITGNVVNNGTLAFNRGFVGLTYGNIISGNGALTKSGTGTVVLTGNNTYTGTTTITSGTLQVGNGGTSGALGSGSIVNNAALVFNRTTSLTVSNAISGTGSLTHNGTGTLTLSGSNTFTGNTTIAFGSTLALGNSSALLNSTLSPGGTLNFGTLTSVSVGGLAGGGSIQLQNNSNAPVALSVGSNNASTSYSGSLTGNGSFTKTGSGTLTLSGTGNITGTTTISGGTLQLGSQLMLGNSIVGGSGSLTFDTITAVRLGGLTSGYIDLQNQYGNPVALTLNGTTTTFTGNLTGIGNVTKVGSGTVTVTGAFTYTGDTDLQGGGIAFSGGSTRLTGNITIGSAAMLMALAGTGSPSIGNVSGGNFSIGGNITTASLTNANTTVTSGTLTLRGGAGTSVSSNTALTVQSAGNVIFSGGQLWSGNLSGNGTINISANGPGDIIGLSGNSTFTGAVHLNSGTTTRVHEGFAASAATIYLNGGTLAPYGTYASGTFRSNILLESASPAVSTQGDGTMLTLTGTTNATFSILAGDTLRIGNGASGSAQNAAFSNNGTLIFNRDANIVYSGTISGAGTVMKTGSGTLTLDGTNTHTGGITISAGQLGVASDAALGNTTSGGNITFAGGTLQATNSFTSGRATSLTSGGGTFDVANGITLQWDGNITGSAGNPLTKAGAGTLLLGGTNTYAGDTVVNAGTLKLGIASALSPSSKLLVASGANFDANGFTPTFADLSGSGALNVGTGGLVVQPSGTSSFTGTLSGGGGFTMSGNGTLTLGAANSYQGATAISNGVVKLGAAGALPSGSPVSLASGGTLDLNGNAATIGSLTGASGTTVALSGGVSLAVAQATNTTFAGALTGTGGLTKSGSGTLTLTGDHTFSGPTAITGGQLKLNGSAASSAFTLNGGGMLSGNSTVGALTIGSGGILSPGNSPGTTNAGNSIFSGGGSFVWEINNAAGTAGTNWDLLSISGTLGITANATTPFNVSLQSLTLGNSAGLATNFDAAANYSFTFVTTTGGISGFSTNAFAVDTSGFTNPFTGTWSVGQSGNNLTLNYAGMSAIPEPSTYALWAGGAALGLAGWRRRKKHPVPSAAQI